MCILICHQHCSIPTMQSHIWVIFSLVNWEAMCHIAEHFTTALIDNNSLQKSKNTTWKISSEMIACKTINNRNSHPLPVTCVTPEFLSQMAPWDQPHLTFLWMTISRTTSKILTASNKPLCKHRGPIHTRGLIQPD